MLEFSAINILFYCIPIFNVLLYFQFFLFSLIVNFNVIHFLEMYFFKENLFIPIPFIMHLVMFQDDVTSDVMALPDGILNLEK